MEMFDFVLYDHPAGDKEVGGGDCVGVVPSRECVAYCHEKSDLVVSSTEPDFSIYCVVPIIYCTAFYFVFCSRHAATTPPS